MKKKSLILAVIVVVFLSACSGSETYQGKWKATDTKGAKFQLFFDAKNFSVKDSTGVVKKYDYTQNSVSIEGSVSTYGIKLEDGRGYQINFPNTNDESVGLIKDENENPVYTISRKDYITNEDIYKL